MDRFIADLVGEGGFFIEAGANDGFRMSNTYLLERRYGWHGLLVEPIPRLAALCASRRNRSETFQCALVAEEVHGATIQIQYADGHSVVGGSISHDDWSIAAGWGIEQTYMLDVPARTLTGLLDEIRAPANPDLLSLDVEGYEPQALAGLDLKRYRPRYVLVEASVEDLPSFGDEFNTAYEVVKQFPGRNLLLAFRGSEDNR